MSHGVKHIGARVDLDLLNKWDALYPHLSRQWFISECFKQAVEMKLEGWETKTSEIAEHTVTRALPD